MRCLRLFQLFVILASFMACNQIDKKHNHDHDDIKEHTAEKTTESFGWIYE